MEAVRKLIENDVYHTSGVVSVLFRRMRYLDFVLIHGITSGTQGEVTDPSGHGISAACEIPLRNQELHLFQ